MGANGDPKTEKGPHGDPGLQMGTHVGAVPTTPPDCIQNSGTTLPRNDPDAPFSGFLWTRIASFTKIVRLLPESPHSPESMW